MAPAKTSLAGLSGTLLLVEAAVLVLHDDDGLFGEGVDAAMLVAEAAETITLGTPLRPPPRNLGLGSQAKGLGTYLIIPTIRGRKGMMLLWRRSDLGIILWKEKGISCEINSFAI